MSDYSPELLLLVRLVEPGKLLPPLPGAGHVLATLLGMSPQDLAQIDKHIDQLLDAAAAALLAQDGIQNAVNRLSSYGPSSMAAIGDSLTADRLGWFALLARVCSLGGGMATFVNAACAGETSVQLIPRVPALLATPVPLILCMAPGNDARRFGRPDASPQISGEETSRALAMVREECLTAGRDVLLITPPGIDSVRAAASPFWASMATFWDQGNLDHVCQATLSLDADAIDLRTILVGEPAYREADGLHTTLAGASQIVRSVLPRLAARYS
ncbi:hypothetical protein CJD35_06465 [Sphingobium xenophagum]|uniref:SGNH hydrolase-type esterase domain-containing protein n=1 Tax=Sphingobium xenophagum TaxID=121428 RepID=A0A249MSK8_SPHXE|nr:SGNH/GDSL hydrolase family protein [Sphingobium xenophagum]ASY44129.1 hypothetical protein CJD35_06465 [Sphingobium xenophagum]